MLDRMLCMNYKFVKFTGNTPRGDLKIAINKSGLIRLSSGFCRVTNTLDFKYAILFYDATNKAIAFKFTNLREEGALRIVRDRTAGTISGKAFFNVNSINPKKHFGRYEWKNQPNLNIGDVYIIELAKK